MCWVEYWTHTGWSSAAGRRRRSNSLHAMTKVGGDLRWGSSWIISFASRKSSRAAMMNRDAFITCREFMCSTLSGRSTNGIPELIAASTSRTAEQCDKQS